MNRFVLAILLLLTGGCANVQYLDQAKRETAYRQQIDLSESSSVPTAGAGPLVMPKEWMDQWQDKPIDKNQNR